MMRSDALKALKRLYGKKAYYRVKPGVSSPERRAANLTALQIAKTALETHDLDVQAKLNALDWYHKANAHRVTLRKAVQALEGSGHDYKFHIGINHGFCCEITASGDTWEECFEEVERVNLHVRDARTGAQGD